VLCARIMYYEMHMHALQAHRDCVVVGGRRWSLVGSNQCIAACWVATAASNRHSTALLPVPASSDGGYLGILFTNVHQTSTAFSS
jgi:hypothetical protein